MEPRCLWLLLSWPSMVRNGSGMILFFSSFFFSFFFYKYCSVKEGDVQLRVSGYTA